MKIHMLCRSITEEILPGGGGGLIKCIDPNEGEALRRGSTFKPGGGAPLSPSSVPPPMYKCLWMVCGHDILFFW